MEMDTIRCLGGILPEPAGICRLLGPCRGITGGYLPWAGFFEGDKQHAKLLLGQHSRKCARYV